MAGIPDPVAGPPTGLTAPGRERSRQPALMLALATVGFALNFWAWALLSPLGPRFKDVTEPDAGNPIRVVMAINSSAHGVTRRVWAYSRCGRCRATATRAGRVRLGGHVNPLVLPRGQQQAAPASSAAPVSVGAQGNRPKCVVFSPVTEKWAA